jgi:hypothetical protein
MKKHILFSILTLLMLAPLAGAQVSRSFISTSGSSANTATNCQKTAPCRLWSDGLAVTNAGGEIVALDAGGFGNPVVAKSIALIGYDAQVGFIAQAGSSGVTINAPGSTVILQQLNFTSSGAGATGVSVIAGTAVIQNCNFRFLDTALAVSAGTAYVTHSDIHANGNAIVVSNGGQAISHGNNAVAGNTVNQPFTAVIGQQ